MNNPAAKVRGNPFAASAAEDAGPVGSLPRSRNQSWHVALVALVLFGTAAFLYTRHNSFSPLYHPDEPSKVRQVVNDSRNYRHPLLLVNAAAVALRLSNLPPTMQNAARAGRFCSAIFAATAVAAFAVLAQLKRGTMAAIVCGALVLLSPQLYELAHFFKEDAALLMGLALFFLALNAFDRRREKAQALLLGVAAGIAVSAKYVGVIALLLGFVFVMVASRATEPRRRLIGPFGLGAGVTVVLINLQAWLHPRPWARGVGRELGLFHRVESGEYALPGLDELRIFSDLLPAAAWLFAAAYLALLVRERKSRSWAEHITAWFPVAFGAAVLLGGKQSDRYYLPAAAMMMYLCGLGMVDLSSRIGARLSARPVLASALLLSAFLLAVVPAEVRGVSKLSAGFHAEHHQKLIDYVKSSLPPDGVIAAERRTGLIAPNPEQTALVPQRVIGAEFASDFGTLAQLRAKGVTHVAVLENNVARFGDLPAEGATQKWVIYRELRAEGKLLFTVNMNAVRFINPGLQLYQLSP